MNYAVTHITRFSYSEPVTVCQNRVCLRPRATQRQHVLRHELTVDPVPARIDTYPDCDGNLRAAFELTTVHQAMTLRAYSEVAVAAPAWPQAHATPPWESARPDGAQTDLDVVPFIYASPFVSLEDDFAAYAMPSFHPGRPLLEGLLDLMGRMHGDFTYDPRATEIATKVRESFALRRGVCQDFAHILCGCLRSIGLPARYVSGYLETRPPPGKIKLRGADASHAWVAAHCPGFGWIDLDPTNNVLPGASHIVLGWGRDYGDVSPVKGVIQGGGAHSLHVSVDVASLDMADASTQ